jgi:hypothetical protein
MAQGRFAAQVEAWVKRTKARQEAVFREAAQRTIEIMQTPVALGGNLPVDTGFLRASLMAVPGGRGLPPLRDRPEGQHTYDAGQVSLVIAQTPIETGVSAVYVASYARFQEYGSRGRAGRRFVGLAAQQWPRIVQEVVRDAKARTGG